MDKLTTYRQIAQQLVAQYAQYTAKREGIETVAIADEASDNYLVMKVGWHKGRHEHWMVFHLRIQDEKIRVEWDGTDYGIGQELLDAGAPKEDIVLAFYDPQTRALTDFAIA